MTLNFHQCQTSSTRLLTRGLRFGLLAMVLLVFGSCGDDNDDDPSIVGPDLPKGAGRLYAIDAVSFNSVDGISVAGVYGRT
ncbi:MAG: hypothetical protein HN559_09415, partial [Gemmatimonadetes bacterium]|nr:hypothetical protein [Gemmatimonadota bacterium]